MKNCILSVLLFQHLLANKNNLYLEVSVDKRVFIIEMPELTDEAVVSVQNFLWDLIRSFESQDYHQLQRYHQPASFVDQEDLF